MSQKLISLPLRKVKKLTDGQYVVVEEDDSFKWVEVSKHYPHSTSAFAALGRLMQKSTEAEQEYEEQLADEAHDGLLPSDV